LNDELSPQQRVQVLSTQAEVALVTGQIETVMALLVEINEIAKSFMPPMIRLMNIESQQSNFLVLLGRTDEAIATADQITAQLQAPMDAYMYFTYTNIYDGADDREGFREWANKSRQAKDQLPPVVLHFIEMQSARLAIWDEKFDVAISHLDSATELLGQSLIQVFQNNLGISTLHVNLAELYLEANAIDDARERLEEILRVFPANAYAKLVIAKVYLAQGNEEAGRKALAEALAIWSVADADYIFGVEARSLMSHLQVSDP